MNEVLQQLTARKSVRRFTDQPIGTQQKDAILEAAMQAPTAGNQQLYTILDIQDAEVKQQLSVLCDSQPFIAKAPLVLVFLADCRRWLDAYSYAGCQPRKPGVGDLLLACSDALIAAQNTVVAAQSLGLGSCYIGDVMENCGQVRALLHLDDYTFPACMLVYGYPTKGQTERRKPKRFAPSDIVQTDCYTPPTEEQLRAMFAEREQTNGFDYDAYTQAFCERKYMSEFSREMTRSVAAYLEAFATE